MVDKRICTAAAKRWACFLIYIGCSVRFFPGTKLQGTLSSFLSNTSSVRGGVFVGGHQDGWPFVRQGSFYVAALWILNFIRGWGLVVQETRQQAVLTSVIVTCCFEDMYIALLEEFGALQAPGNLNDMATRTNGRLERKLARGSRLSTWHETVLYLH